MKAESRLDREEDAVERRDDSWRGRGNEPILARRDRYQLLFRCTCCCVERGGTGEVDEGVCDGNASSAARYAAEDAAGTKADQLGAPRPSDLRITQNDL